MKARDIGPTWSRELIGPEEARDILEREGIVLRDLADDPRLAHYREDIACGRWMLNGDTILFTTEGRLLDGKFRLAACYLAKVPLPCFVVRGVDAAASATIDARRKRKSGDVLYVSGIDNGRLIAAAANAVVLIARGNSINGDPPVPSGQIIPFSERHPDLVAAVDEAGSRPCKQLLGPSILAAMLHLTRLIDVERSERFFAELDAEATGNGKVGIGVPTAALARALENLRRPPGDGGAANGTVRRQFETFYVVRAWNAFYDNATIHQLQYRERETPRVAGVTREIIERLSPDDPQRVGTSGAPYAAAVHGSNVYLEIVRMTPEHAERLLENNGPIIENEQRNRRRSSQTVASYARDMRSGKWLLNGQAIKVSAEGRLLDGQHRLAGCVLAGAEFDTFIVHGLPDEAFTTYDLGARKRFAEEIAKAGIGSANVVQIALRLLWQHEQVGWDAGIQPTHAELSEALSKYGPSLGPSATFARRRSIDRLMTQGAALAVHYILTRRDPEAAEAFFDRFDSGANLELGSPVLAMRERLLTVREKARMRLSERQRLVIVTTAFEKFVRKEKLSKFTNVNKFAYGFGEPTRIRPLSGA